MVSTDSCLAVSMKLHVLTTRISASSGREVRRAPPRSSNPIITSESTRFLGQPNETKPTVGAVGWEVLLTFLLYRECDWSEEAEIPDNGAPQATVLIERRFR